jgi:hypothetical protein
MDSATSPLGRGLPPNLGGNGTEIALRILETILASIGMCRHWTYRMETRPNSSRMHGSSLRQQAGWKIMEDHARAKIRRVAQALVPYCPANTAPALPADIESPEGEVPVKSDAKAVLWDER